MPNTLLDNVIEHWSFENTANGSAGSHNMTLAGSPTYQADNPGFGTYSLRTNGSSQYCYVADHADWDNLVGTGEWAVGMWIKPNISTTQFLLNNWTASAGTRSWILYLTGSTLRLRVEVSDTAYDADWSSGLSSATWYCVMVWRTGDSTYISVDNGTPVSTSLPASASIDGWVNALTHGTRAVSPLNYYNGYIAGLSLWSADIGSSNRTEFYNSGSGLAYGSWSASGGGGGLSIPVAMHGYRQRRV